MGDIHREWRRSLLSSFACIECHMPDSNVLTRIVYKARAGLRNLYHENLQDYLAAIDVGEISSGGRDIPRQRVFQGLTCLWSFSSAFFHPYPAPGRNFSLKETSLIPDGSLLR